MENITIIPAIRASRMVAGKAPIIIRIIIGRTVAKTINTGIKVSPLYWDSESRTVMKGESNAGLFNMKLKKEVSRLEAEFIDKSLGGIPITKARARKIAEGKDPGRDFYKFCKEWVPKKYTNKETLRTYTSELTKLKQFSKEVSFGDIDMQFLTGYKRHMETQLKNSSNTIWKSFKFLNTMMRDAIKMKGLIDRNPFEDFDRGSYENPVKLGLELMHCNLLQAVCLRDDVPVLVRRVVIKFLLMCYSGLRFEDAMIFDPEKHVINNDRIILKTQKAGVSLNMKLYDRLSQIIDMIKLYPLPPISNQEFNKWLKVVANLAGIGHMKLTSHVGRHTFGGLLAEMEIPEEQAQKLLAHKDIRSTRQYYHIKGKNLDKAMDKLNNL